MIHYNMRYRGAMEYDKFILNIFQFHNEIHELLLRELRSEMDQDNTSQYKSFGDYVKDIDDAYKLFVGTEDREGFSERIYLKLINYKER